MLSTDRLQRPAPPRPVVTSVGVARLPRWPLWLLCAAYVLPGFIGRDPWTADAHTFGVIWQMAQGRSEWLHPTLWGLDMGDGWVHYWLGALSVKAFAPLMGVVGSSRVPFMGFLVLCLVQTWYAAYHFALRDAAQPVQPAFGEAIVPSDYARAMADGALLTMLATLGLLTRGHVTSAGLPQLCAVSSALLGLALLPRAPRAALPVLLGAPVLLATTGAPWLALFTALLGLLLVWNPAAAGRRGAATVGLLGGALAAALVLWHLHGATTARLPHRREAEHLLGVFIWFVWPAWPLAAWAVWRWRASIGEWHVLAPLGMLLLTLVAALLDNLGGAPLLLALPSAATLGALALPVMRRGSLAALDWFALMAFTLLALLVWVLWLALMTGFPSHPAANIARLAPGYVAHWRFLPVLLALLATLAWGALVTWRAGRHRHPLWKGMVLSAGGVTLVWVLVGTLWLPVLDYASSYRPLGLDIAKVLNARHAGEAPRVRTSGLNKSQLALLGYWSGATLVPGAGRGDESYLLVLARRAPQRHAEVLWSGHRPGESDERFMLLRR